MRLRRRSPADDELEPGEGATDDESSAERQGSEDVRASGPWDADEHPVEEGDETRVDLGSLSVKGRPGLEVRLQVDEASQQVAAVMLLAEDGALELRGFAAARHEDLWPTVHPQISSEAARRGGTATEVEGPYGPALQLEVPGVGPDGKPAAQRSTVFGIAGPRWMLRVTMFGRPAVDYQPEGLLEQTLRDVVVDRGSQAMPPGEALPLRLPAGAQRAEGPG
jgi:hypothetical protein